MKKQPNITPAGGLITKNTEGKFLAFNGDDDPRYVGTYDTHAEAFNAAETAAANDSHPNPSAPTWQEDLCHNGVHPKYGGRNWGVHYSEHWNDYQVNHGYYGAAEDRDGHTYIDGSDTPLAPHEVRWTCDQQRKKDAETVWQHRELVTAALHQRGHRASEYEGIRLRIEVTDTHLEIYGYDHPNQLPHIRINRYG